MTTSLIREALALSISGGVDPVEMQWFDWGVGRIKHQHKDGH